MCCIFEDKPTWNYSILFLLFNFSQQFYCRCSFESSSILFIIRFFIQKVHPWHMPKYSSMSPNIPSYVSNNIPLTSEKYSFGLICSCSCVHHSRSHTHKIASLDMVQCCSSHKCLRIICVLLGPFDRKWISVVLQTIHGHKKIPSLQLWFFSWWNFQHSPS